MDAALDVLRKITNENRWRAFTTRVISGEQKFEHDVANSFATYWIEAGHKVREQVADDQLLCVFLRTILPRYEGAPLALYRGENLSRWKAGCIGLAWTKNIGVARMFATGLNAVCTGGVLLKATFDSSAIICGPNAHSVYLGEEQYTVDPTSARELTSIEQFPVAK